MSSETEALGAQVGELLQFVYLMPVAIVKMGAQGEVQMVNPAAVQLLEDLDLDLSTQDGLTILEALNPGLREIWGASLDARGAICAPIQIHRQVCGTDRHLVLKLVRPDSRCSMLVMEDVTGIVEKEREISRQRQRFSVVMEQIQGYCVVMLDAKGRMLEWNPSIDRMFGTQTQHLEGQTIDKVLDSVSADGSPSFLFEDVKTHVNQHGSHRTDAAFRTPSGMLIWGDMVATPTVEVSGGINGYVFVIRDVTVQHLSRELLLTEALTDPLTGLFNRRGLEHRASIWFASEPGKNAPSSWIMADIDHFKKVNDTYGHDAGDDVLKLFAKQLKAATRKNDVIVRLGGEEFLILLPGAPIAAALDTAERIRVMVEEMVVSAGGNKFSITSSFGVMAQSLNHNWHEAVTAADAALYQAKTSGRNRVVAGTYQQ